MGQSLLYQHRERGSFLICCLVRLFYTSNCKKPNPSSIPLLLQCASWRYTLNDNVRKTSFLRVGFPRILYVNPTDTFLQVFSQVNQYVFPEYRHHLALFQKRMEVIVQLVFASVALRPISRPIEPSEKKMKKEADASPVMSASSSESLIVSSDSEVSASGEVKEDNSVVVKNEEAVGDKNDGTENTSLKPTDISSNSTETSNSPTPKSHDGSTTNNETTQPSSLSSRTHENHKRQFFQTLNDPIKCYPENRKFIFSVSAIDVLSWLNFTPGIPVINHYLYTQALSSPNPPVWLSFIFRQEHLMRSVSSLIGVQGSVKSLFMLLDDDEGVKPIIPAIPENDERRKRILTNYSREVTEPKFSMDVDTVREFTQGQNKREEVPLQVCLESMMLDHTAGKNMNK